MLCYVCGTECKCVSPRRASVVNLYGSHREKLWLFAMGRGPTANGSEGARSSIKGILRFREFAERVSDKRLSGYECTMTVDIRTGFVIVKAEADVHGATIGCLDTCFDAAIAIRESAIAVGGTIYTSPR